MRVLVIVLLVSFTASCFAVESYSSLKQKYDKALEQLEAEHKAKVAALDKAFENALASLREEAIRDGRVEICALADDVLTICINGVAIIEDYDYMSKPIHKNIKVTKGDIITVKCFDKGGGGRGFFCVIKFANGYSLLSKPFTWKAYKPKSTTKWFDKSSIDKIYDPMVVKSIILEDSLKRIGLDCPIIWSDNKEETVYLFTVIQ